MKPNAILVGASIIMAANTVALVALTSSNQQLHQSNDEIVTKINKIDSDVKQLQQVVMYKTHQTVSLSAAEQDCLTRNVFYEAGVEDYSGKIAVAQVTLNRLEEGRWGKDVCKVVFSPSQFSWTKDRKKRWSTPKGELWSASKGAVRDFVKGVRIKNLEDSHFYHTDYIKQPFWAKTKREVHKIGQHVFYAETKKIKTL